MELISSCKQFKAFVEVGGSRTEVYQQRVVDGRVEEQHVEGYIASESGKEWTVTLNCQDYFSSPDHSALQYPEIGLELYIDGKYILKDVTNRSEVAANTVRFFAAWTGLNQYSKFQFKEAILHDQPNPLNEQESKSLATIELRLYRVKRENTETVPIIKASGTELQSSLSERAQKGGLSNLTGYGTTKQATRTTQGWTETRHPEDVMKPWQKMIFRYYSREILQARGLLQESESPSAESDPDTTLVSIDLDANEAVKTEPQDAQSDEDDDEEMDEKPVDLRSTEELLRKARCTEQICLTFATPATIVRAPQAQRWQSWMGWAGSGRSPPQQQQ